MTRNAKASPAVSDVPRRRGRPPATDSPGLTQAELVSAVIRLAEDHPEADINMRDLAKLLSVSPKLLYRHVKGKDELLDLAAASILENWSLPSSELPWAERLTQILKSTQILIRRYPSLAQAVLMRNLEAKDSPEVARHVDAIIGCFVDAGLSLKEADEVFFLYKSLILGELTMSKAIMDGTLSSDNIPNRADLDAGFERCLHYVISGIAAHRDERNGNTQE